MNTIKIENKDKVLMVAHRGVSGIEKENTCSAFVAAGNRSYYGIETDVHRTRDGRFVCIHDGTTGRVAIDNLNVEESTFDTLRSLVLTDTDGVKGRIDLRIPTLQEYVRVCRKYGKVGVLELKTAFEPADLQKIIDIIKAEDYLSGIIFISFNLNNMIGIRALLPQQPCQFIISDFPEDLIDTLVKYSLDLDIYYKALTQENLAALKEKGIRVNVWTVDKPEDATRLIGWGVDYITSNILE